MPLNTEKFQNLLRISLEKIFEPQGAPVRSEWRAIENIHGIYSPRIDIAVGPFSTTRGGNCIQEFDILMDDFKQLIMKMIHCHCKNVDKYRETDDARIDNALHLPEFKSLRSYNRNARCFLAIEIENQVSRKHLLGGVVNSCALGRVGIAIGGDEEKVRALIRLLATRQFYRR